VAGHEGAWGAEALPRGAHLIDAIDELDGADVGRLAEVDAQPLRALRAGAAEGTQLAVHGVGGRVRPASRVDVHRGGRDAPRLQRRPVRVQGPQLGHVHVLA
jgi:hypothetical protein